MSYLIYTAIAVIAILVIVSAIFRKRTYKEVDRLEEWKNEIINRAIPDEIGKVKQLQMSGQTEEKFEEWRNEWDDIVVTILPQIEEQLFDIEELATKNRFNNAKQLITTVENRLNGIEVQLTQMLGEIDQLVQSEQQNRTEIDDVKASYKKLYAALMKKRGSLGQGLAAFDERFDKVNNLLTSFDEATAEGSYLQARDHLVEANDLLTETESLLERYPKLLVQIETTIPSEIKNIREGMEEMEIAGYKLEAFALHPRIDLFHEELVALKEEMASLKCDEVEQRLKELSEQIEQVYEALEYEVQSKQYVTDKLSELNERVEQVNQRSEELAQETEQIQQSYHLSEEHFKAQDKMKEKVFDLTKQLDVLEDMSLNEKQTFTSIREMVDEWQVEMEKLSTSVERDKESLFALREDEWRAKETLRTLRDTMLETKRMVQKSNIPGLPQKSLMQLDQAEQKLMEASVQLEQVPLELGRVNVLVQEAVGLVNENEELIKETIHQAALAEKIIQFGNRYRSRSQAVEAGLIDAEQYFRQFEYEEAIECAVQVIKVYEPDVLERVEEYVSA
ncbi:septation ring formation regulator EzrA [Halalkalibacter nanhaiisediminis]|uniref:Septation ring formation regulator n=1 Tax=Halalkalibacter nanhaiisediminis TaxID=688079 RepID=A0A562QJP1_9BACI|nr:septation ring formation regulator EzrA [Halalkalibacter nanhaiisediminis]TWI56951.1 septation ring formation regulator [Halalkalibacter nanhaiisediminis]